MAAETGVLFWRDDDHLFLIVRGRITAAEAYAVYQEVHPWLHDHPQGTLFIDLDQTDYVDSTTIGTLVRLKKECGAGGGELVLTNPSDAVDEILSKMKLRRYFHVATNGAVREAERNAVARAIQAAPTTVSARFVLDAHNDICTASPEMRETFAALLSVLESQVDSTDT